MKYIFFIVLTILTKILVSQTTVSGYVSDFETGERLIGAYIMIGSGTVGTTSDNDGFFSIKIKTPATIAVSYVGYKSKSIELLTSKDTLVSILLESGALLDEVLVVGKKERKVGKITLSAEDMRTVPVLGAKPDVLKILEAKPGIQMQHEGSSLMQVRGGDAGQNLYLFDGVPLIHVHHFGGFLSVFNPDIINGLDLYVGAFPARYGGKLSSILDISQREGDKNKYSGSFSFGVTDASGVIEGPAMFKNSSFIVTARKTFYDALIGTATYFTNIDDYVWAFGFHDINAKLSWRPHTSHSLYFNLYQGDDYLHNWSKKTSYSNVKYHEAQVWGNWLASGRWVYTSPNGLTGTQTLSLTRYRLRYQFDATYNGESEKEHYLNSMKSTVVDYSGKSVWKYRLNNSYDIEFGGNFSFLKNQPKRIKATLENSRSAGVSWSQVNSLFIDNNWNIGSHFWGTAGVRATAYQADDFLYLSAEPRLDVNYSLLENLTLNAGYMHVNQYNHLLMAGNGGLANEIWIAANERVKPASVHLSAVGFSTQFFGGTIEMQTNGYYKKMRNLAMAPIGSAILSGDEHLLDKIITNGRGDAYGIEFSLSKGKGKFKGDLAYTYSRAFRKFEGVNNNDWFVSNYDRPHSINATLRYKLNKRVAFAASWSFSSGMPYTPIIGRYLIETPTNSGMALNEAFLYGDKNSARMKNSHRLDIGMTLEGTSKRGNRTLWTFSVYNAYNRKNPVLYYYNTSDKFEVGFSSADENYQDVELYQKSFFTFLPSVSYKVFFDGHNYRKKKAEGRGGVFQLIKDWATYQ
jgi:hypothetical protein